MKQPTAPNTNPPGESVDDDLLSDTLLEQINAELDQQPIHGSTLSRIRRGRETALQAYDNRQTGPVAAIKRFASLTTLAPVGLLTLILVFALRPDPTSIDLDAPHWQAAQLTDIELLSGPEEPAMFTELEFYFWLEEGADSDVAS
ncbi:MAG: hypothetical protein JKY89_02225 [Immundisolibacteraceae bacterium]|nr:hypothetical protein [Immundisolibacteraceae bacterium]